MINPRTILLLSILFCMACKVKDKSLAIKSSESNVSFQFPMDWIGKYEGPLLIFNDNKVDTINMQLIIGDPNMDGFYPWTLVYGDSDIRSYGLEAINPEKGHYRIDEFNSIKIDGYLRHNHFVSRFSVLNSDLIVDYERIVEGIKVNFYVTGFNEISETGGEIIANDTVPVVKSYPLQVIQSAILKKSL